MELAARSLRDMPNSGAVSELSCRSSAVLIGSLDRTQSSLTRGLERSPGGVNTSARDLAVRGVGRGVSHWRTISPSFAEAEACFAPFCPPRAPIVACAINFDTLVGRERPQGSRRCHNRSRPLAALSLAFSLKLASPSTSFDSRFLENMAYIPSSAPTIYSNSPEMTQPTLVWDASRTTSSQSQPPALSFVNISANYPEHAVGVSGGNGSLQERPLQLSHTSGTKIRLSHAAPTALSQVTGNISAYQQRAAPLHSANPSANGQYTSGEGTELDTNLEAPFSHRAAPFHDISDALEGYHATAAPRRSPTPSSAYGSDETTENNISPSSPLDLHKPTSSSSSTPASNGTHKPSFIEPTDQSPDKSSLQPEHGSFSPPKDSSSTANNLLLLSSLQPSPPLGIAERRPRRAKTASKLAGKTGPVRTHAATKIPVNLLPTLYEDLLKKLSDEGIVRKIQISHAMSPLPLLCNGEEGHSVGLKLTHRPSPILCASSRMVSTNMPSSPWSSTLLCLEMSRSQLEKVRTPQFSGRCTHSHASARC